MSQENLYEYAQDFEELFKQANDIVEQIEARAAPLASLSTAKNHLSELDYLLNQMDLELSLMGEDD